MKPFGVTVTKLADALGVPPRAWLDHCKAATAVPPVSGPQREGFL